MSLFKISELCSLSIKLILQYSVSWLNEPQCLIFSWKGSSVKVRGSLRERQAHIWGLEKEKISLTVYLYSVRRRSWPEPVEVKLESLLFDLFLHVQIKSFTPACVCLLVCLYNLNFLRVSDFAPRRARNLIHKTHNYKSDREVNEQCCAPLKDSQG